MHSGLMGDGPNDVLMVLGAMESDKGTLATIIWAEGKQEKP